MELYILTAKGAIATRGGIFELEGEICVHSLQILHNNFF